MTQATPRRGSRTRFVAVVFAALLIIAGVIAYAVVESHSAGKNGPAETAWTAEGDGVEQLIEIAPGSSVSQLGPELVDKQIVKSNAAFQKAAGANPDAAMVKPGFVRLQGHMTPKAAVAALVDPANQIPTLSVPNGATLMDVTVVGGKTRFGIYSLIQQISCPNEKEPVNPSAPDACVTNAKLEQAAAEDDPKTLGVPEWALQQVTARGTDPRRLEGLIAPGEYVVDPRMSAHDILAELIGQSATFFADSGLQASADAAGMSPYDLLTAASLVEREAPADSFDKVARVIVNRLAAPMKLQFDSTVNYDLPDQEIATTVAARKRPTPWNTYVKDGLPDTPIASPSKKALHAVEHPAEGKWLYFVTVDQNGTTLFNETLEGHERDIQKARDNGVLDSNRPAESLKQ